MATKKVIPAKKGKAPVKPVAKAPAKAAVKPAVKKVAKPALPAKKASKPTSKPAAKTPAKQPAKPVAKPAAKTPAKQPAKPVAKPVAKKLVTKVAPVKAGPVKKVNKTAVKPVVIKSKVIEATPKKVEVVKKAVVVVKAPEPVVKISKKQMAKKIAPIKSTFKTTPSLIKPMAKKEEVKKVIDKTMSVNEVKPTVKAKDVKVAPAKPVVIPKITTKTVKKYEPDFTKSVLDATKVENTGPTQRYSDNELKEFRELIQRKLEAAKKELSYLHGLITRKDEMGGDEGDNRYMTMEDGSLSMEREQLSQMASRQITFIDHLEKAIMRIENKTYGICRVTGKLIDKARLRAVPHATLSIEAKMGTAK
jgi:RNA polymerase-binding transcription factor DksA